MADRAALHCYRPRRRSIWALFCPRASALNVVLRANKSLLTAVVKRVQSVHAPRVGNAVDPAVQPLADRAGGLCPYGFTGAGMLQARRQTPLLVGAALGAATIRLRVPVDSGKVSVFPGRTSYVASRENRLGKESSVKLGLSRKPACKASSNREPLSRILLPFQTGTGTSYSPLLDLI